MRVDKSKARTPNEEFSYIWEKIQETGNFFAWEVHPNKIKVSCITKARLEKKLKLLVASEEFKAYNPGYELSFIVCLP